MSEEKDVSQQGLGMTSQVGPLEIDWPRTTGYYGGVGLALAFELVEPPLAIFIAAIPVLKMLNNPRASRLTRFVGQLLEGAARPVGGSAEATIQLTETLEAEPRHLTMLEEARQIAERRRGRHAAQATAS